MLNWFGITQHGTQIQLIVITNLYRPYSLYIWLTHTYLFISKNPNDGDDNDDDNL